MEIQTRWYVLTHSVLWFFFQIIADIISPFYIIFLFLRTSYYPLKDLLGEGMCYFYDYLLVIGAFAGQFHSFYLTAFRYICLFHDDFMLRYNIRPKVQYLFVNWCYKYKILPILNLKLRVIQLCTHVISYRLLLWFCTNIFESNIL